MEGMQYSDTPITAFISEDLSDIWQPIRDFLEIYRLGDEDNSRAALSDCLEPFLVKFLKSFPVFIVLLGILCYTKMKYYFMRARNERMRGKRGCKYEILSVDSRRNGR